MSPILKVTEQGHLVEWSGHHMPLSPTFTQPDRSKQYNRCELYLHPTLPPDYTFSPDLPLIMCSPPTLL